MTRIANFSSSAIHRLMNAGKRKLTADELAARPKKGKGSSVTLTEDYSTLDSTALTYIKEKVRESKLKRSINNNAKTRPIIWGKVMEMYCFENKLGLGYRDGNLIGRLTHPECERNTGIPDFLKGTPSEDSVVADIKCPTSLTNFCDLYDHISEGLETFKDQHKDYYWQLVNNAAMTFSDKAEFMYYVPYASELPKIQEYVQSLSEDKLPSDLGIFQIKWISDEIIDFIDQGKEPSFAYLPDDCEYKDFNVFAFDVPKEDKDLLTDRVKLAVAELEKQLNK